MLVKVIFILLGIITKGIDKEIIPEQKQGKNI